MIFASFEFYIFLIVFLLLIFFFKNYKLTLITVFSLFFYLNSNIVNLLIFLLPSIFLNYLIYKYLKKKLLLSFLINLAFLIYFKYLGIIFNYLNLEYIDIYDYLPLGISFITFQQIQFHLTNKYKDISFLEYFGFISFFPQLISGPIIKSSDFIPKVRKKIRTKEYQIKIGFWLIIFGISKKLVADILNFELPLSENIIGLISKIYLNTIILYFDFSGYTDVAIGVGKLLGFNLPKNFNRPFRSKRYQDFWSNWNITLTNFFKNFLFLIIFRELLKKNIKIKISIFLSIIINFLIIGIWHGAGINFIFFGLINGIFVYFSYLRIFKIDNYFLSNFLLFNIFSFSLIFFFYTNPIDILLQINLNKIFLIDFLKLFLIFIPIIFLIYEPNYTKSIKFLMSNKFLKYLYPVIIIYLSIFIDFYRPDMNYIYFNF